MEKSRSEASRAGLFKRSIKKIGEISMVFGMFLLWVPADLVADAPKSLKSTHPQLRANKTSLQIAVVGDTGIGQRAFHWGFLAVQEAIREKHPDVLLHLGDFVYPPKPHPPFCPPEYIKEIQKTLVDPFPHRLFVPGDNDRPFAGKRGCWEAIDPLDTPFDEAAPSNGEFSRFEGTKIIGNVFFAVLNTQSWQDPTAWLAPRIKRARENGQWVILALHEPAITTAWYLDKKETVLKQLNRLEPDLVFSANQHSYERFNPLGIPEKGEALPVRKSETSRYQRGDGTIHIISGGGGATIKPFADQQAIADRTAPEDVFNALAERALMNHFVFLEISDATLTGTTYRVCPGKAPTEYKLKGKANPRWRAKHPMWQSIPLECDDKPVGVTEFERFEILRGDVSEK